MRQVLLVEGWSMTLPRLREDAVIEQVAHLLESRRWHVCEPAIKMYPINVLKEGANAAFTPVPRRGPRQSEAPPPLPEVPEGATLPVNADQDAIAAVLKNGAQLGVPFCEECVKRALGRAAAAAIA
jgi:hypothetical protein